MAQEMGHGGGMDMAAMVRDMRNRFWMALAFTVPIFALSPMGMDFIKIPPPFGLPLDLGAPWSLDFQCLPLGEPAMVRSGAWVLQLEWAGARFVLRLPAGGNSWQTAAPGLPTVAVYGLTVSPAARTIFAATHGRGVWRLRLGS